jgi:hypothetical protein
LPPPGGLLTGTQETRIETRIAQFFLIPREKVRCPLFARSDPGRAGNADWKNSLQVVCYHITIEIDIAYHAAPAAAAQAKFARPIMHTTQSCSILHCWIW